MKMIKSDIYIVYYPSCKSLFSLYQIKKNCVSRTLILWADF